jgi:hypothetical protein
MVIMPIYDPETLGNLIFFAWVGMIIPFWIFLKTKFPDEEFDGLNFVCEMIASILWPFMILGYLIIIIIIKYRDWRNYVRDTKISRNNLHRREE